MKKVYFIAKPWPRAFDKKQEGHSSYFYCAAQARIYIVGRKQKSRHKIYDGLIKGIQRGPVELIHFQIIPNMLQNTF